MDSDKISKLLEKHLKVIGKRIRLDILKQLYVTEKNLSFSEIQKEILGSENNSVNLSFHLNVLKEVDFIESSSDGYLITKLGKKILIKILDIEQTLNEVNEKVLIRTSKYSTEPFNIEKVRDYLVKEAEMDSFLANQIAKVVKKRLLKTNIKYLTTPLMREYINGILLEEGLEHCRHKLTRLGVPPFDTFELFHNKSYNPDKFIKKLGSEVSEQFLLLNLLPNKLADLYLSNRIILLNLNYWAIKPLSIFLQSKSLLQYLIETNLGVSLKNKINNIKCSKLIIEFCKFLDLFNPYFSSNILLVNFEEFIDTFNFPDNKLNHTINLLLSQISRFNRKNTISNIELGLNLKNNLDNYDTNRYLKTIQKIFETNYFKDIEYSPYLFFNYLNVKNQGILNELLNNLDFFKYLHKYIFYNGKNNLLNSNLVSFGINNSKNSNKIILDKILINLHYIALEAHQDDDKFYEILENRIYSVFDLFKIKESLMIKKIGNSIEWQKIIDHFFEYRSNSLANNMIKSVSFIGLNEAIKHHCGLELDQINQSELFALKIMKKMKEIINMRNNTENNKYCLSQPHNGIYLKEYSINNKIKSKNNTNPYSYRIIRKNSKLPIERHLSLFKKFNKIIDGGSLFEMPIKSNKSDDLTLTINKLLNSNLTAFKFNPIE